MRILFVADRSLAQSMQPALEAERISVEVVDQIDRADCKVQTSDYDVILLDRLLFRGQGYSSLLRWRRAGLEAHILVLLPRDSTSPERAGCLDAGADAYLLQPLASDELCAHLRVLKRRDERVLPLVRRVHDLEINVAVRTVKRGGRTIRLTPREFELLQFLAFHQGKVVSRSMIREHLYNNIESNDSNVVDVYVRYLRNKIDKGFETPLILTRWGQGYLLRGENA